MMKFFTLLFTLLIVAVPFAKAQQKPTLAGDWKGYIEIQGRQLVIKTHFKITDDGYSGMIDIPQQGAISLRLQKIDVAPDDSVSFAFQAGPGSMATFKGTFKNDSTISGQYHQNGATFPFELKPMETVKKAPLPYHHKDVIIKNDAVKIGGTLTWPENKQAHQLVIMISGSGAQDRDETIQPVSNFKPFAELADSLTASGFATFRYDDRGIGESTGSFADATLDMLAGDVKAIITHFKNDTDPSFDQIILLGHSQGGEVAGKTAAEDVRVDRLILMSSPGISLKKVLHYQVKQGFSSEGIADSTVEDEITSREDLMEAIHAGKGIEQAQKIYHDKFKAIQVAGGVDSGRAEELADRQTKLLTQVFASPQMKSLLFYNPPDDLKKLDIPVLALFGGKDTQVLVGKNKPPIKAALEQAKGPFQINTLENANHLYQHAKTGQVGEYATLPDQFLDGFLPTIEDWLRKSTEKK